MAFAGDVDAEEVRVCVEALAAVRHPNLVALTAFCAESPAMLVEYFASEVRSSSLPPFHALRLVGFFVCLLVMTGVWVGVCGVVVGA